MDTLTPERRSRLMARVHGKDTQPELLVRRGLWARGFRYRLYAKLLPGSPDLWFPKAQVAVFVQGCFWHGHEDCPLYRLPGTRPEQWLAKVEKNRDRDLRAQLRLLAMGYNVALVWECALRKDAEACLASLARFLKMERPPGSRLEIAASGNVIRETLEPGRWD